MSTNHQEEIDTLVMMHTDMIERLDAIAELYRGCAAPRAEVDRFYCFRPDPEPKDPEPKDRDGEEHFKWAFRKKTSIDRLVRADRAIREACDAFFVRYMADRK